MSLLTLEKEALAEGVVGELLGREGLQILPDGSLVLNPSGTSQSPGGVLS